jgi:ribonuclease HI
VIAVYSDGSSSGRSSKPGGYGFIIVRKTLGAPDEELAWGYGGSPRTTNNLMEMQGAIMGLRKVLELGLHKSERVELVSDSQYTLGIASGGYSPSSNVEEATALQELAKEVGCGFRWVRGHAGERYNEGCDELAKAGKLEHTPKEVLDKKAAKDARRAVKALTSSVQGE